jgi:acetylornithine deacetylase/succinyl-diaminopimelate desuccinylase-like protein
MSERTEQPTSDVVALAQQLIRNACVNDGATDSGQEVRNADVLAAYLEGSGADLARFEAAPGRTSVVARIEGSDPGAPSLCLMGHTDVVPANPDRWTNDPFGGEILDGVLWGRGAIDMFNLTASMAVSVRKLAESGRRPRSTVIYLAVADEEASGVHGAEHLGRHEPDAVRCDYCITESGGFPLVTPAGVKLPYLREEKGPMWARLRVSGTPGHASMPYGTDNALVTASKVVQRISEYRPPTRLDDAWRAFVAGLGLSAEMAAPLLDEAGFHDALPFLPPGIAKMAFSCTHTTMTPTMLDSGVKTNVIPEQAEIALDVRVLPGDDESTVRTMIAEALGDLAGSVEVHFARTHETATSSPAASPLLDSLRKVVGRFYPGAELLPMRMVGSTDARHFRRLLGTAAYGFGMFSERLGLDEIASMAHGDNERIDLQSLEMCVELWDALLDDFCV